MSISRFITATFILCLCLVFPLRVSAATPTVSSTVSKDAAAAKANVDSQKIRNTLRTFFPKAFSGAAPNTQPTREEAKAVTAGATKDQAAIPSPISFAAEDELTASALVGRWGNSGVRYGFSDDGYFYRSTVLTRTYLTSTYHPSTTRYSGDYRYYTPGWTEYKTNVSHSYLNTLFGQYKVRDGVIRFDNVISISHTSFDSTWYYRKTRGAEDEKLNAKFQNASFSDDFIEEFEFISPTRLRLRDKDSDRDFFWDLDGKAHDVPVPARVIPPVAWPAKDFSPDMPVLKIRGRLREVSRAQGDEAQDGTKTTTLVIDKAAALADIRSYVKTLRGAGWWAEEPKADAESLNLEARKGLWQFTIKNGNGPSKSAQDTIVIKSVLYPEGKWPQAWAGVKLEPPLKSRIIGRVKNKADESDRSIREKVYFDGVDDNGVKEYAARLRQAGFTPPPDSDGKWLYMKYIRIGSELYRAEVTQEGRYGAITAFNYHFKYFPDGAWPVVWRDGGLFASEGSTAIVGAINMKDWDDKDDRYGSFSANIKFLGLDQRGIDAYWKKLQSSGFVREKDRANIVLYKYLRLGGRMSRVEIEQRENAELAEIRYSFKHYEDGAWPTAWQSIGIPAPRYSAIVGAFDLDGWKDKKNWRGSFYTRMRFLGANLGEYADVLRRNGFTKPKYAGEMWELEKRFRIDGVWYKVTISDIGNGEIPEAGYTFREDSD